MTGVRVRQVSTKYTSLNLATTFPLSFLDPLMRMSLAPDPEIRLIVQQILHTLIDRRGNLDKLDKPRWVGAGQTGQTGKTQVVRASLENKRGSKRIVACATLVACETFDSLKGPFRNVDYSLTYKRS